MKRLILLFFAVIVGGSVFAQKDVTKFLGIPVDGYKPAMIQKLKAKGFVSTSYDKDVLEGEFNGEEVEVRVVTNNNKVYRIGLSDKTMRNETNIRIRFNKLVNQFKNNPKYIENTEDDFIIPDNENISYNITVKNKRYEAVFYQKEVEKDSIEVAKEFEQVLLEKYSQEEIDNPTKEQRLEMIKECLLYSMEQRYKKTVWFMINEHYGKYSIIMFYDNEYNHANGEDL